MLRSHSVLELFERAIRFLLDEEKGSYKIWLFRNDLEVRFRVTIFYISKG